MVRDLELGLARPRVCNLQREKSDFDIVMIVQSIYMLQTLLFLSILSQNKAENICDPGPQKQS